MSSVSGAPATMRGSVWAGYNWLQRPLPSKVRGSTIFSPSGVQQASSRPDGLLRAIFTAALALEESRSMLSSHWFIIATNSPCRSGGVPPGGNISVTMLPALPFSFEPGSRNHRAEPVVQIARHIEVTARIQYGDRAQAASAGVDASASIGQFERHGIRHVTRSDDVPIHVVPAYAPV